MAISSEKGLYLEKINFSEEWFVFRMTISLKKGLYLRGEFH